MFFNSGCFSDRVRIDFRSSFGEKWSNIGAEGDPKGQVFFQLKNNAIFDDIGSPFGPKLTVMGSLWRPGASKIEQKLGPNPRDPSKMTPGRILVPIWNQFLMIFGQIWDEI